MLQGLGALFDHLGRHADRTCRHLAQGCGHDVYARVSPSAVWWAVRREGWGEEGFDGLVGDEEESGAGGGAEEGGTDAGVDGAEGGSWDRGAGLETRF